jgi:Zn-dependent protease with chaperone function
MKTAASYTAAVTHHRKQAKAPKWWLRVIFGFYFLSLFMLAPVIVFLHLALSDFGYDQPPAVYYLQLIVFYISFVVLGMLGLFVRVRYREIVSSGHRFIARYSRSLKTSQQLQALYPVLQEVGLQVGVSPDMQVLPIPQSSIFPSVEQYDGNVVLVLPLGYLPFLKKHPEEARFILAHELSHIRQQDLYLFRESEAYGKVLLPLIITMQGLSLLTKAYVVSIAPQAINTALTFSLLFVPEMLTILSVIVASVVVKRIRLHSEELADYGAALAVTKQAGVALFEKIREQHDTSPDRRHPAPGTRIAYLNNLPYE